MVSEAVGTGSIPVGPTCEGKNADQLKSVGFH